MRERKVKFFALFPCFFPEPCDAPVNRVSFGKKKSVIKTTAKELTEPQETETIKTQTHGTGASTSSSVDEPAKSSPSSLSEIEEAKTPPEVLTAAAASKVREVYKKSKKPNSDVTNAMTAELRDEDEKNGVNAVSHKKGLSCHPVMMEEWNLVMSIPSDNEEGEGHTSDYEC